MRKQCGIYAWVLPWVSVWKSTSNLKTSPVSQHLPLVKDVKYECVLAMGVAEVSEHLGGGGVVCTKLTLSKTNLDGGW